MRGGAFLGALLGTIVGLLFGMLLWGGGAQQAAHAPDDKVQVEIRDALRDIRTLLEQQPAGAHSPVMPGLSAPPAAAQPEPLAAGAGARSAEELRAALDEAITALHGMAEKGGGGFADAPVSADAAATLKAQLGTDAKDKRLDLFGCSPRDVHEKLGRPIGSFVNDGLVNWDYNPAWPTQGPTLRVSFADGYVVSQHVFNNDRR